MHPTDDSALLRRYAANHSDEAFAALVTRHINLVYSVALRHTDKPAPERPSDRWRWPRLVQADAQGGFQLPSESDPTAAVLIVHESGVRELALADFKQKPELAL